MKSFTSVDDIVGGPGLEAALNTARAVAQDPWVSSL
jgi:hypothetical protein